MKKQVGYKMEDDMNGKRLEGSKKKKKEEE